MKKIAIVNFHPAFFPPKSGGELRYWNLSTRLSEAFRVHMVNPTFGEAQREDVHHTPTCTETRIPKNRAYNAWHHAFDKYAKFKECSALVSTLAVKKHPEFLAEVRKSAADADIVMHSSCFMAETWMKPRPGQLLVYDSYNVEARLARESLGGGLWGKWGAGRIKRIEENLCRAAHLILACSREDADEMAALYGVDASKIVVVPNGVDVESLRPPESARVRADARARLGLYGSRPALLFLGSFHPPNIEAVDFIRDVLAPNLPAMDFVVAGKVCDAFKDRPRSANLRFLGLVSDETKHDLLMACDIALNPMFSGSGTNLKMLETLAVGMPVITTPFGARGLELVDGEHAMVVEAKHFLRCIQDVVGDPARQETLRRESRRHAEERFGWHAISENLRNLLEIKTSPRIVMVNDYPMSPVTSGGKIRLNALGHHLSRSVAPVTLVTLTKEKSARHVLHGPRFEEVNIPRSRLHGALDALVSDRGGVSADDASALLFWRTTPAFRRALARESRNARVLLFDHTFMVHAAAPLARRIPAIYESHNVETLLKRTLYPDTLMGRFLRRVVERGERRALRLSRAVTCVSPDDRGAFIDEFGQDPARVFVADNGVDCGALAPAPMDERAALRASVGLGPEPTAVFLGSGHPPNADAARFIIHELAPATPNVTYLIVGNVCGWFYGQHVPSNVVMIGEISTPVKDFLMRASDFALNPLSQGSGSSLKVPEYLRAGLPVVSSLVGARGFTEHDGAIVICERPEFAHHVERLASDPGLRESLALRGRALAESRFDWAVTLKPLEEVVRAQMVGAPATADVSTTKPAEGRAHG